MCQMLIDLIWFSFGERSITARLANQKYSFYSSVLKMKMTGGRRSCAYSSRRHGHGHSHNHG